MGTGWIAVQRLEIRKRIEAGRYLPFIRYLAEGEISLGMFYHDKFYHLFSLINFGENAREDFIKYI